MSAQPGRVRVRLRVVAMFRVGTGAEESTRAQALWGKLQKGRL